jgi:hypothetical protein
MIRYLKHQDIDPAKWDACIERAANGLIYAYSFYLDHMATNWDALVLGDYEAVMPLTWRKKLGIYYLYQPTFVAQGGVFGTNLTEEMVGNFLQAIPKKFRLIEINLNSGNILAAPHGFTQLGANYVLPLNAAYKDIYASYRDNIKRNIKKAVAAGCTVKKDIPVESVVKLSAEQLPEVHEQNLAKFQRLYADLHERGKAITYGIFSANDELLASCVYFFSHNRAYYILVGNHPNGRTLGASHYLIDRFIEDHANSNLLLDFEGSDIRSLAFFYQSFGSNPEIYPVLRINRLPWYINALR